jgi:hypothetical protein
MPEVKFGRDAAGKVTEMSIGGNRVSRRSVCTAVAAAKISAAGG